MLIKGTIVPFEIPQQKNNIAYENGTSADDMSYSAHICGMEAQTMLTVTKTVFKFVNMSGEDSE